MNDPVIELLKMAQDKINEDGTYPEEAITLIKQCIKVVKNDMYYKSRGF